MHTNSEPYADDPRDTSLNEVRASTHTTASGRRSSKSEPTTSADRKPSMFSSGKESDPSLLFGVDWSDRAHPTSHCWLPHCSDHSSSAPLCAYVLCTISRPIRSSAFVQCGSCTISVHRDHLTYLQGMTAVDNHIPLCRLSFSDDTAASDSSEYDRHYWSFVPALTKPCMQCKRKKLSGTRSVGKARSLTTLSDSGLSRTNAQAVHVPEHSDSKFHQPGSGLVCLWCSQGCHRRCWESLKSSDDLNKCGYGKFKNIIVRPQWIHRGANPAVRFQARYTDDVDTSSLAFTPVIVLINKLSGGQKGQIIYRQLLRLLNPRQVFLLENDATVKQAMDIYSSLQNIRICVCGGDGTAGWILSSLADIFPTLNNPPVSICPLGTGNDLSRVLGWGWCYNSKRLLTILLETSSAQPIALDRWQVDFEPLQTIDPQNESRNTRQCLSCLLEHPQFVDPTNRPSYQNHQRPLNVRFTNYISFGLDGAVVLDFHEKRLRDPSKFTSPLKNKLLYLNIARRYFREFALWKAWNLGTYVRLICDGKDLTDSLRRCHTVVLLNIPSYGSGTHPWSRTSTDNALTPINIEAENYRFDQVRSKRTPEISNTDEPVTTLTTTDQMGRQSMGDHKIEVLGLNSMQMALIHIGFRGRRIAQCNEVRIELIRSMPVHMDGEPFYLPESIAVNVTHAGQVSVLRNQEN